MTTIVRAIYTLLILCLAIGDAWSASPPFEVSLKRRDLNLAWLSSERTKRAQNITMPIGGSIGTIGLYFTEITDTGSSTLFIPAKGCVIDGTNNQECLHISKLYEPSPSSKYLDCSTGGCSSCRTVPGESSQSCVVTVHYGDGSFVNADAMTDVVTLAGTGGSSFNTIGQFGAIYQEASHFATLQNDGLWGLGYQPLSKITPFFDSMVSAGVPDIFSMCLNQRGGALVLGGVNPAYQIEAPQYTPITRKSYYVVNTIGLTVGGNTVATALPETIVDSGTTLFLLPSTQYEALKQSMQFGRCHLDGMCGSTNSIWDGSTCFGWSDNYLNSFPTITITLQGVAGQPPVVLTIPPSTYFLQVLSTTGRPCRYFGIDKNSGSQVILGDTIMQRYNVIFDRANSRIGFAQRSSACDLDIALVPEAPWALDKSSPINVTAVVIGVTFGVLVIVGIIIGVVYCKRAAQANRGGDQVGYNHLLDNNNNGAGQATIIHPYPASNVYGYTNTTTPNNVVNSSASSYMHTNPATTTTSPTNPVVII